jgi:hypothetical protein
MEIVDVWILCEALYNTFVHILPLAFKSRSNARDMATGWIIERSEFESRKNQEFLLLHIVQTGSEAHPTSYAMGTRVSFSGAKAAGT